MILEIINYGINVLAYKISAYNLIEPNKKLNVGRLSKAMALPLCYPKINLNLIFILLFKLIS